MQKTKVLVSTISVLGIVSIGFIIFNLLSAKKPNNVKELSNKKEIEFEERLDTAKERIKKDLEEKYRADMVSYEAMSKRLEAEREKSREIQEELEELKKSNE